MPRFTTAAVLLAVLVLLAGRMAAGQDQAPPQAPPAAATPAPANVDEGRELYNSYGCYQCHGYEAQGGVAGPRIGPDPLPLAAFRSYVRRPAGQMPPYTAQLVPDADIDRIHAFLESLPAPPPVESLPLLQQ